MIKPTFEKFMLDNGEALEELYDKEFYHREDSHWEKWTEDMWNNRRREFGEVVPEPRRITLDEVVDWYID